MRKYHRHLVAITIAMALAACVHVPPANPQIATDALRIESDAKAFFTALAAKPTPDCAFATNIGGYDSLKSAAMTLRGRVASGDPDMAGTIDALGRTIDGAARAHELASQRTDDANGLCMAPAAITLNADAVDRAAMAVLMLERKREGL